MKRESDFGKGCVYCIGLFLAHAERFTPRNAIEEEYMSAPAWFNASSDHLYELQIPENFPEKLKNKIESFRLEALEIGHGSMMSDEKVTFETVKSSILKANEILMDIDNFMGVEVIKAEWQ